METIVLALGGNAILKRGEIGTAQQQVKNIRDTAAEIVQLVKNGFRVVITHGNGPQVGNILIQNELGREKIPSMPMDVCGAESQGMIGYMIQLSIRNALLDQGLKIPVVSAVTQVLVDRQDQAFSNPSKPVGPFHDQKYAESRQASTGEKWIEDSGRGWRRVVPSPDPKAIVEVDSIKALVNAGHVVVSVGGGGIPVVQDDLGHLTGVEAVIDKDLGAQRLAMAVGADTLLILTDVPGACLNFGTSSEKLLGTVRLDQMKQYDKEGHFRLGSMGPKVKAIIRFLENGGKRGIISSLGSALPALKGQVGTRVIHD